MEGSERRGVFVVGARKGREPGVRIVLAVKAEMRLVLLGRYL